MVAAQLVNAVPHTDAKFYAATQTMDEARHVEVFARYIEKLDEIRPIAPSLKGILDQTLTTGDWMKKLVGMQIVVDNINEARQQLLARGVDVSPIRHVDQDGQWQDGAGGNYENQKRFEEALPIHSFNFLPTAAAGKGCRSTHGIRSPLFGKSLALQYSFG